MSEVPTVLFERLRHDEDGRMLLEGEPFTGTAVEYWPGGAKASEMAFSQGVQHGLTRGWHPNGAKSEETNYEAGNAVGVSREWHENGQLKREQDIRPDGTLAADREWDEHGLLLKNYRAT